MYSVEKGIALIGELLWRRTARALLPIYLLIGYFTLVHVVTIASLRYRLPIEPFLIVMAAYPIGRMAEAARRKLMTSN